MYFCKAKLMTVLIRLLFLAFDVQSLNQRSPDDSLNNVYEIKKPVFGDKEEEDVIGFGYRRLNCTDPDNYYKKNFTTPGRRISEIKCLEYIWDTKFTEYVNDLQKFCDDPRRFIIGGRPILKGEFSHMGALGWLSATNDSTWIFKCGATLISKKFMLTSAHCSQVSKGDKTVSSPYPGIVQLGDRSIVDQLRMSVNSNNWMPSNRQVTGKYAYPKQRMRSYEQIHVQLRPKQVPIKRFIKHENYKSPKHYYDIALIELSHSITIGPVIRPACLWSSPDTTTLDKLLITGWGITDPITLQTANVLQVAEVNYIKQDTCDELLKLLHNRKWQGLADHQICAGFLPGGIDTCPGDSGGPLQVKINLKQKWSIYFLVGVTSFGFGRRCGQADTPGVYVKTSSFIDWIENIVWPDNA